MSRYFSSSARALVRYQGLGLNKLPKNWMSPVKHFVEGGAAEAKLGKILEVDIKSRGGNPVHQSHFNRNDKEFVISARIIGVNETKTCHVYQDGTGTLRKGDCRE